MGGGLGKPSGPAAPPADNRRRQGGGGAADAHPEKNLKIAALTDDASLVCIPMRKGEDSKSLREAVDQAIDEIRESGELAKLSDKYFGNDISQEPKKDGVTD